MALVAIAISLGFPIVVFALRNWLMSWIAKSVQHSVDVKIERLRTDLRKNEEQLKSDLRRREAEIASLRETVFSMSAGRRAILDKRRIDSVEKIWTAVNDLAKLKVLSQSMSVVKYDAIAKQIHDPKMQQFVAFLGTGAPDPSQLRNVARDEQPFVPELTWAYFSAYTTVLTFNLVRYHTLKSGIDDPQKLISSDKVREILKAALPHYSEFIDQHGHAGYHYLLDELEGKLLVELRKILDGKEADQAAAQHAKEIMSALSEPLPSLVEGS